jgi:benzylsuccinate CoA-transferase BbsF subunit
MLISLLSALEHRRKTGTGQHIDISQAEAAIHLLAPAIYDYGLNGHIWHRAGNRDLSMAPNGVFPTAEDEAWIAISARNDSDWQALCQVLNIAELAGNSAFATLSGRQANESVIEQRMTEATKGYKAEDLQAKLIAAGVPAHKVLNSQAASADPQFKHWHHFIEVPHTPTGSMVVENIRFQFSRTPGRVERAGPELGEHNFQVLKEILGYDDDRIADVYASLAME